METQVESLKSSGGVVQSSHIHWHFSEQGGCILVRLMPVICLHSAQTAERGDRWMKISKADNRAFCPWWCNVGRPGKTGEEPELWFLLEQRAEFSHSCFYSVVSSPPCSAPGQDLQRDVSMPGDSLVCAPCSTGGCCGFPRSKPRLCEALITQWEQGLSLTQG